MLLLKTPPGSTSKCSCSRACKWRLLILVTWVMVSREITRTSRSCRNVSPNLPIHNTHRLDVRRQFHHKTDQFPGQNKSCNPLVCAGYSIIKVTGRLISKTALQAVVYLWTQFCYTR